MALASQLTQRKRFNTQRKKFNALHTKLKKLGKEPFVMPFWQDVNKKALESFQPLPQWDFLSNQAIKDTMFVAGDENWLNTQIAFLERNTRGNLRKMVKEDPVGKPVLLNNVSYNTSHNTLHHLYHIFFYLQTTKVKKESLKTVVEWGGGYGNFAKLWKRNIDPSSTYIIIDTALFCSIQYLYLTSVLGPDHVHVLDAKTSTLVPGKVNLVPLALLDTVDISGDLFVSTWGLSESLDSAQDYVVKREWFGAKHLLIGFQNSTADLKYAARLGELASNSGAKITDIEFIPNNHYAFK